MGDAFGDEQGPAPLGVQLRPGPAAETGAARPQVQRDIEDPPPDDPHQLGLPMGGGLVVHAPQGEGGGVPRQAGLGGREIDTGLGKFVRAVQPGEGAAIIDHGVGVDEDDARDLRGREPHQSRILVAGEAMTKRPPQSRI